MKRLGDLIRSTPVELRRGSSDLMVNGIEEDSRRVHRGCLFIARPGTVTAGSRFIPDAVARGSVAVLTGPEIGVDGEDTAHLVVGDVPRWAAVLAERYFDEPSRELAVVGVTGTNGKTTVASLVHQMLNATGMTSGLVGTVQIDDGHRLVPASLTTPPALELASLLRRMVQAGCRVCAMEISSHALAQRRTDGLHVTGAVFTNLSGDHMDYHGTPEAYATAKARLFAQVPRDGWAVVNVDDAAGARMAEACAGEVLTTSLTEANATCFAEVSAVAIDATRAIMHGPWGRFEVALPLVGRHNVANALQAVAVAQRFGLDAETLRRTLSACHAPPGRLEPVVADGCTVLVDYAHTDDALENVLRALRPLVPDGGRLCTVFGCGGDRDRTKRPRMARAAWRWSDDVVVTSDNPRTEEPRAIVDEVLRGVPPGRRAETKTLVDRREAIAHAVTRAITRGCGDVVLIAGKGHEDYQIIGSERLPFDDRQIAADTVAAFRSAAVMGTAGRDQPRGEPAA